MINSRGFWHCMMAGSVAAFAATLILGHALYPGDPLRSRIFFLALLLMHLLEIPLAVRVARDRGVPAPVAALKTLPFGFTWWIPLKKGVFDR